MALTDHIAILTHAALGAPALNRKKKASVMEFYGLFAFPPAAATDLAAVLTKVAPGGSLDGLNHPVKRNNQTKKPIPGVPGDWFVIRAATQFAPYIADAHGKHMPQDGQADAIRAKFYAGKKVRVALTAFAWPDKGDGPGVSYNLAGVMEAGDGERLAIGNSAPAAFEKYADKTAPASAPPAAANLFGGSTTQGAPSGSTAGGDNPFAQTGAAAGAAANPFA